MIADQVEVETSGYTADSSRNEVLVKTYYIKDDETIEEEENDTEGNTKYVTKLKYPNGRKVIVINDMVVWDKAFENDDKDFPYQRLVNYINARKFWGISELEPLESPQRVFNKLVSYVLDVLFLMGNPIWIVDSTSDVDTQNLTNQPGLVVEKSPGSEVRRESGVQLQPYVLSVIDRVKEWFDSISGSQDITRGIAPGGVTAAAAISDLQNAAQTRIRLKIRNLEAYLQDLGQAYASRVLQYYTAPRVFRITGRAGAEKYFKMHITKKEDEKGNAYHVANVQNFTDSGLMSPEIKQYELKGKLDLRVTSGSSLPFSKAQNEQRLFSLFDRQIIDATEVLKGLDYPNYEAVLLRKQEADERQAQLQAQAQQQGNAAQQVA